MENKLEKIELTNYNLLIAQDLWQAHYLADEILRIKCKYRHDGKNVKTFGIKQKNCGCCFEFTRRYVCSKQYFRSSIWEASKYVLKYMKTTLLNFFLY